jgi:hypothetical protein
MPNIPGHKENANLNHIKIPPYSFWNGYHQEHKKQPVLANMWEKRNPHTILVGMQISTTSMENSAEAPQKTKNRLAI